MNSNISLLTTAAKAGVEASINNFGAAVYAHTTTDWQAHSQFQIYNTPVGGSTAVTTAAAINATLYTKYKDNTTDLALSNPASSFTTSAIQYYASTKGHWFPLGVKDFGADFQGNLVASAAGSYTFYLSSDDGAWLWIDGSLIIQHSGQHASQPHGGTVTLSQGSHTFEVKFYERNAGDSGDNSGVDLTLPVGVSYGAIAVVGKTITDTTLRMLANYGNGSSPSSAVIAIPVIFSQFAPTANFSAPVIVVQPVNQQVKKNTSVTFSVSAVSTSALTYQWFFNTTAIAGATSSTYTIAKSTTKNSGSYAVNVGSQYGNTLSNYATLQVV